MWRNDESTISRAAALAGALADPGRVRILCSLRPGERCVCQVVELLGLAPSTISRHLVVLREAGLILGRREGKWMHYRLPGDDAPAAVRRALEWLFSTVDRSPEARADAARMRRIVREDPAELCCRRRECA